MKFKVLSTESSVTIDGSTLLFGVVRDLPYMDKDEGLIILGNGDEPERKPNQKWAIKKLYPIGNCNLAKIEELKRETNSKDDNELFNKIIKEKYSSEDVIDFSEIFR